MWTSECWCLNVSTDTHECVSVHKQSCRMLLVCQCERKHTWGMQVSARTRQYLYICVCVDYIGVYKCSAPSVCKIQSRVTVTPRTSLLGLLYSSPYEHKEVCLEPEQDFPNCSVFKPANCIAILRISSLYPLENCLTLLEAEGYGTACAWCEEVVLWPQIA